MTTTADLRAEVDNKGREVSQAVHQIENRLEQSIDWQKIVQEKPLQSLGVAVGLGLILSGGTGPLLRSIGGEVGALVRNSLTAYVVSVVVSKHEKHYTAD